MGAGQQGVEVLDLLVDAHGVVGDVSEEGSRWLRHSRHLTAGELRHRLAQGRDGTAELRQLPLQCVDAACVTAAVVGEHRQLGLVHVRLELGGHVLVRVDHAVTHAVEHGVRSVPQHFGVLFEVPPGYAELRALAMAHRDDVVVSDEDRDLTCLDRVVGVDVPDRLEHHEQGVAVPLELRPLVGDDGVLDRERVKSEHVRDLGHLVRAGLEQPDPDEVGLPEVGPCVRAGDVEPVVLEGDASALVVEGAVNDHASLWT